MQKGKIKNKLMLIYVGLSTFLITYGNVYADDTVCESKTIEYIRGVFDWVKISIPVILILTGSVDFVKAIIASDDQKMKKAQKDFITRLIIGVAIFFIPSIIEFLLAFVLDDFCTIR